MSEYDDRWILELTDEQLEALHALAWAAARVEPRDWNTGAPQLEARLERGLDGVRETLRVMRGAGLFGAVVGAAERARRRAASVPGPTDTNDSSRPNVGPGEESESE